jgi:glycosyltransferase involved in cell wall biosynthesis
MKLLVFAHTPPPHHGQSYMVQLMLEGLGGDRRGGRGNGGPADAGAIECYHVNAQLSRRMEDIGTMRAGKFLVLLGYCLQAIWCRFRYGVTNFYYIPAPGKCSALYRDWMVLWVCRPFFRRVILHWHAAGLAKWLEMAVQMRTRVLTFSAAKAADLSIVLSNHGRADAEKLYPKRITIVSNGIPDPCPDFTKTILPRRNLRFRARAEILAASPDSPRQFEKNEDSPHLFRVLFLGHCTREKGLFDTLEAVARANKILEQRRSLVRMHLTVAGEFLNKLEAAGFQKRVAEPDLCHVPHPGGRFDPRYPECLVAYRGFVSGSAKNNLFVSSDCFCFPSFYYAESFGLVLVEAMAFGLPIVTTRRGALQEVMPAGYPGLVDAKNPSQLAEALVRMMQESSFAELRSRFEENYTVAQHLNNLSMALRSVEAAPGS